MKHKLMALAGAAAIVAAGFVGAGVATSAAEAQQAAKAPVVLIVDRAELIAQSKAGKTIPDQIEKIQNTVKGELEVEASKLQKDIESYQKNASLMSQEVREKTEKELAMRQQYGLPQQVQIMEQALQAVLQNAENKVLIEATPILKDIVEKRGATLMLDKSAVLYAASETDITAEVIAALDKKLTAVEVEQITLAEVQQRLKEAAAEQQKQQAEAAKNSKKK
ncbi:MAG: OmpH family outer membrane protein [Amphiplicatus sp.]